MYNITLIFDRCHRRWAAETPDKYEHDWKHTTYTFAKSKCPATEKLTNRCAVTPIPGPESVRCHQHRTDSGPVLTGIIIKGRYHIPRMKRFSGTGANVIQWLFSFTIWETNWYAHSFPNIIWTYIISPNVSPVIHRVNWGLLTKGLWFIVKICDYHFCSNVARNNPIMSQFCRCHDSMCKTVSCLDH